MHMNHESVVLVKGDRMETVKSIWKKLAELASGLKDHLLSPGMGLSSKRWGEGIFISLILVPLVFTTDVFGYTDYGFQQICVCFTYALISTMLYFSAKHSEEKQIENTGDNNVGQI